MNSSAAYMGSDKAEKPLSPHEQERNDYLTQIHKVIIS